MIPKSYFEDEVSAGVARGAYEHAKNNRFTIVNLPVGYGKTIISILTAMRFAKELKQDVQIGVIAPKAKRLDNSFVEALDSAKEHFGIGFSPLYINGQTIGTFSGFSRVASDKTKLDQFVATIKEKPTIFILDETHMTLRKPTTKTSKGFAKMFKRLEKANAFVKVIGLTATPVDTSILDAIGYLVFNGQYSSETAFYREEIVGYKEARLRGLSKDDVNNMIIDDKYKINKRMFIDIHRVVDNFKKILYRPKAPKTFHIPENVLHDVKVTLTEETYKRLDRLNRMDKLKAFPDPTTRKMAFLQAYTTDDNMLKTLLKFVDDPTIVKPIIFYEHNIQRDALRELFRNNQIEFAEISGESHSFFDEEYIGKLVPVIVQYRSGSTAFESMESNTSIYLSLPDSSIDFEQALGRNTRRDQKYETVNNYILEPTTQEGKVVGQFLDNYMRIRNKTERNLMFLSAFDSEWGEFNEIEKEEAVQAP